METTIYVVRMLWRKIPFDLMGSGRSESENYQNPISIFSMAFFDNSKTSASGGHTGNALGGDADLKYAPVFVRHGTRSEYPSETGYQDPSCPRSLLEVRSIYSGHAVETDNEASTPQVDTSSHHGAYPASPEIYDNLSDPSMHLPRPGMSRSAYNLKGSTMGPLPTGKGDRATMATAAFASIRLAVKAFDSGWIALGVE
ncbi:hypothetical protein DENSPDRAFT_848744 [Dentipellis sp. KUC8613]|nr:hypothetical protein DENSPDRAFT_848744 [Dentipellis sp. KUC8613]